MISLLKLLCAIIIAFLSGKLITKLKLPSILGWLITGMILGPHAVNLVDNTLLHAEWYELVLHIFECSLGLMIGTELVFKKLKQSGMQIFLTTLSQSLGTFFIVTACFGLVFYSMNLPIYLAAIMGGIALATAPAPALSIVKEFKTKGPVTKTLIPMAALDDIVGILVFFTIITLVEANGSTAAMPLYIALPIMILLPLIIGSMVGFFAGILLKKNSSQRKTFWLTILLILCVSLIGLVLDIFIFTKTSLNFMLIGMAFAATFSNIVSEERLAEIVTSFNPILSISLIVVILNLGAPLDYHLILDAGLFTAIYILSRASGKYLGAYFGAKSTGLPKSVQKYLGLTLLPHSGVSLVFTGIAATALSSFDPASATIIQGTIAAAAVINEIIAVIVSKKAFEWAGELNQL